MDIEFYIDPDTGQPHIFGHGVEMQEVIDVLKNAPVQYNGRGGTKVAMGQTREGRYLKVIFRQVNTRRRRIITAFDLPEKTKRALRRLRRRRP